MFVSNIDRISDRRYQHWLRLLIGLGLFIRLYAYLYNRSLWYDEAMLVENILHRSFTALTGELTYGQLAPIGFLWLERALVLCFGGSEYVLRLLPFLCGIVAVWLFARLSRQLFSPFWALVAVAFFVFHGPHIYYTIELKQYSVDVLAALLVVTIGWPILTGRTEWKAILSFGILAAILVWCSQPVIFVLASLAIPSFFIHGITNISKWLSWNIVWLISFGCYYFLFLQGRINQEGLDTFHQQYFMPWQIWEISSWQWYWDTLRHTFREAGGFFYSYLAIGIAVPGLIFLWKKRYYLGIVWVIALILAFFASTLHLYSTAPRLLLFACPGLIWLVVEGLASFQSFLTNQWKSTLLLAVPFLLAGLLFLQPFLNVLHRIASPEEVEDIKSTLQYYKEHSKKGEQLYIYHYALPAFNYYQPYFAIGESVVVRGASPWEETAWKADFEKLQQRKGWILLTHYQRAAVDDRELFKRFLDIKGTEVSAHQAKRAAIYLYQFN